MTNIVERLRDGGETCDSDRCRVRDAKSGCLCAMAADEIERLRAEVQTWINHTKTAVWSDSEECKFLTAENERLRAALTELVERCYDDFNGIKAMRRLDVNRALAALARATLETPKASAAEDTP